MNSEIIGASTETSPREKSYSPFWAIWIVFLTFVFLQASYFHDDFTQRSRIEAAETQLKTPLTQTLAINRTIEAVSRELLALAPDSAEAAKIIAEFNIILRPAAQPAK